MIIAARNGAVLRQARIEDFPQIDALTIMCYTPIQASYVAMLGEACYEAVRPDPELTWEERKTDQNHRLFSEHPEWVWVLEEQDTIIGFVTFYLIQARHYGHIDNNGVHPEHTGKGWGKWMYQHVLDYFREHNLLCAHVDTGLDPAHLAARRAYESVGFDRKTPNVDYWQDLREFNPGSTSMEKDDVDQTDRVS